MTIGSTSGRILPRKATNIVSVPAFWNIRASWLVYPRSCRRVLWPRRCWGGYRPWPLIYWKKKKSKSLWVTALKGPADHFPKTKYFSDVQIAGLCWGAQFTATRSPETLWGSWSFAYPTTCRLRVSLVRFSVPALYIVWFSMPALYIVWFNVPALYTTGLVHSTVYAQGDLDTMRLVRNGAGTQWDFRKMVLVHNGPGTQWVWYTMSLGHNESGTQWVWYTMSLGHDGSGTQWVWYTMSLGHDGSGTQWAWYTVGLVHNAPGTQWVWGTIWQWVWYTISLVTMGLVHNGGWDTIWFLSWGITYLFQT